MSHPHSPHTMPLSLSSLPLSCPICLDILHQPVTVPCGHNFCLLCVQRYWDTPADRAHRGPQCPQCREMFDPRPRLNVNTVLAELTDRVRAEGGGIGAPRTVQGHGDTPQWRGHELQRPDNEGKELGLTVTCFRCELETGRGTDKTELLTALIKHPGRIHQENLTPACAGHHHVSEEWSSLQPAVPEVFPNTREELLRFSRRLCLDPCSANRRVLLSQSNRRATLMRDSQEYGEHPERFMDYTQVLGEESLSGRGYLEVEWSGWGFYLSLSYRSIPRSGAHSRFDDSDRSWALHCEKTGYDFYHRGLRRDVPGPPSSRLGLLLDVTKGLLVFFSLSSRVEQLHTIRTCLTEPLYLGFRLYSVTDYVELCELQ